MLVSDPLSTALEKLVPIQSVLRSLSAQDGCDGSPYDEMVQAADYIDQLEQKVYGLAKSNQTLLVEMVRLQEVAVELLHQLNKSHEA